MMKDFNLEELFKLKNVRESFFLNRDKNKPIIFYGFGNGIKQAWDIFEKNKVIPNLICDTNSKKWKKTYRGVEVCSIENVLDKYDDYYIYISAPTYLKEIIEFLKKKGVKQESIVYFNLFEKQNEYKEYLNNNKDFLDNLLKKLKDEKSKYTLKNMIKAWYTSDNEYYFNIYSENQYFCKDIVTLTSSEIFLDVGAFDGDTFNAFIENSKNSYEKVYLLEPNYVNLSKLELLQKKYKNIEIISKGAYDEKKNCYFYSGDDISVSSACISLDSRDTEYIEVDRLDNLITDKVTFIKMDIEGSELKALEGARNIILKYKPKLAIAIYHKMEDLIEIPKKIMDIRNDYDFFIRHHSNYTGETILYAL